MPICPNQDVPKLTTELQRITARINTINGLNIEDAQTEVTVFFETKQSKMNFFQTN